MTASIMKGVRCDVLAPTTLVDHRGTQTSRYESSILMLSHRQFRTRANSFYMRFTNLLLNFS